MKKLILALMVSMFSLAATAESSMPCELKMGSKTVVGSSTVDSDGQTR